MVALCRELALYYLRIVEVEDVLDRYGHELCNLGQERDIRSRARGVLVTTERQRAEPPAGGRQRKATEACHTSLSEFRHQAGPAGLGSRVGDEHRLLRLDHQRRWRLIDGYVRPRRENQVGGFQYMSLCQAALRVVKHEAEKVEGHDTAEIPREMSEELLELATRPDRLGDGKQRPERDVVARHPR
jgi:hypothetical protein